MSGILSQRASTKSNIGLRNLFDVNEGNFDRYRPDTIYHNQLLVSYNVKDRPKEFVFKYITDLLVAGTGVTFTTVDGVTTIDASGGVSPLTTKGDLYTFDTADARLPVGTNGQVLYADSTTATGLKWDAAPTGGSGIQQATASGTDTYTATIAGVTSYTDGDAYLIRFTNGNTTGCTLNINGLGALTLYRNNDGALLGGDIVDGAEMLCIYNSILTGFQVIGTAPNTLLAYVTNDDSVTLTKGMAVYAFSGTGDRMTVKRASNTADATSAQTVGLVLSTSIAANQKGLIMMQGLLDGLSILPTATYTDGEPIYLGSTAGSITNVKPYAPNHLVYLGVVTTANNGSAGRMYIKVQNGYELDELHNVQAQSPTYKDTLWYDNTVSPAQWKTASLATILGYTPVPSTRSLTINGTSYDLSADRTWTIGNIDPAIISVTETAARLDNWAPTGWPGTTDKIKVIQLTANYTDKVQIISGLGSGVAGRTVTISNLSTDNLVILESNSTSSLAANRFKFLGRGAYFLFPGDDITFIYNGTQWSQLSGSLKNGFTLFDDFGGPNNTGTAPNQSYFGEAGYGQSSGTGSLVRNETSILNSMGVMGLTTGTTTSGFATVKMNGRSTNGVFGSSTTTLSQFAVVTRFALSALPTVAQDYRYQTGLCANSNANGLSLTGLMGWYCTSANANWKCYTSTITGGLVSDTASGLVVSTNLVVLGTYHPNIVGDTVFFYSSDGGMTYTVDSRFVRVSNNYGGAPVVGINKSAGLISVTADTDYIGLTIKGTRI